ncbi:M28 family metallopeptidase [uncultured Flavonifractor sp.]|uniref:M28 family metallopeptidase n=1 Tax=uncultured Flavonifractor sp. TaxID=1193534 RepID=UPI0026235107|nr:M28 family metallopeptidase [uncultured Flavonifractor sp.]
MRRWLRFFWGMLLVILLAGCSSVSEADIPVDLRYLTGETCSGRLAGTLGNQAAADYIAQQFQQIGLSPMGGSEDYFQPYVQETFDPNQESQILIAQFADGSTKSYHSGVDFYPLAIRGELRIAGEVRPSSDETLESASVLDVIGANGETQGQIICASAATATLYTAGELGNSIRVPEELFVELLSCTSIQFQGELEIQESTVNNVIGVYSGESHNQAILITAHFDHVGGFGDVVYPGAMDNASGVAVLLQTARYLIEQKIELPYDVVFCAFNGEDMGLQGSKAFCEKELPYEQVNGINIDTVGANGADALELSDTNADMASQMTTALGEVGLSCSVVPVGNSDHNALLMAQIPTISIGEAPEHYETVIHTPGDTIDNLDTERMEQIVNGLVCYLSEARLVSWTNNAKENDLANELLRDTANEEGARLFAQEQPDWDEMVVFQVGQIQFGYWMDGPIDDLETVRERYNMFQIPEEKNGFTFVSGGYNFPVECTSRITEKNEYSDDIVQKRVGMQRDADYYLRYVDEQGIILETHIMLTEPWAFSVEDFLNGYEVEATADERLYLLRYGGIPAGVFWYEEGNPYAYHLDCVSSDGYQIYSLEQLAELLSNEILSLI